MAQLASELHYVTTAVVQLWHWISLFIYIYTYISRERDRPCYYIQDHIYTQMHTYILIEVVSFFWRYILRRNDFTLTHCGSLCIKSFFIGSKNLAFVLLSLHKYRNTNKWINKGWTCFLPLCHWPNIPRQMERVPICWIHCRIPLVRNPQK